MLYYLMQKRRKSAMQRYSDCPQILRDFLAYHESIKGQSPLTISEYHLDLRMFLRFMKLMQRYACQYASGDHRHPGR